MIILKTSQWFDLNLLGIGVAFLIGLIMFLLPLDLYSLVIIEITLVFCIYWLKIQAIKNQKIEILVNSECKWFIKFDNSISELEIKDYWLIHSCILIWLKGEKKSISFMIRRSIIGDDKYCALRSKII